jgi:hypothetical protein
MGGIEMPQLIFKGIIVDKVKKMSAPLVQELADPQFWCLSPLESCQIQTTYLVR